MALPFYSELNPPWILPPQQKKVIVYVADDYGYVKTIGSWDRIEKTWRRADGMALKIFGWRE
jgi:hypothetical protein